MVYNDKIPDLDQLNRVCLNETKLYNTQCIYANSYKPSFNDKTFNPFILQFEDLELRN